MRDAILWRRLDTPGHDACRLVCDGRGWRLEGTAVFLHDGAPASLSYLVVGSPDWLPLEGRVQGFIGDTEVDVTVARGASAAWLINGTPAAGLDDCQHLDFGFTPATNLPHVRWLDLEGRASAPLPVAWLKPPFLTFERLAQQYTRRSASSYLYEAPEEGFTAELLVAPSGFVRRYPGLWDSEQ